MPSSGLRSGMALLLVLALDSAPCRGGAGGPARAAAPWDLDSLYRPPSVTVAERGRVVTSLYYEGEPYRGKPTRVFAYLARPEKAQGRLPAMVLVHGGGGTAFPGW